MPPLHVESKLDYFVQLHTQTSHKNQSGMLVPGERNHGRKYESYPQESLTQMNHLLNTNLISEHTYNNYAYNTFSPHILNCPPSSRLPKTVAAPLFQNVSEADGLLDHLISRILSGLEKLVCLRSRGQDSMSSQAQLRLEW